MRLSAAATRAAVSELEREREALQGRHRSNGLQKTRRLLTQLPRFAADFERQLQATLLGQDIDKHEMRTITEATRDLIEGSTIRLRSARKASRAWYIWELGPAR